VVPTHGPHASLQDSPRLLLPTNQVLLLRRQVSLIARQESPTAHESQSTAEMGLRYAATLASTLPFRHHSYDQPP
ncbi:hypothetical protein HPB47_002912, partial [Ixodes persulcatus]